MAILIVGFSSDSYLLARALDLAYPDDSWIDLLARGDDRAELLRRKQAAEHWDVTMPLTTFAEIGHLIHVIPASSKVLALLGETNAVAKRLMSIPDLRNRVAHVVKPVVAGPKQISSVADQVDLMFRWIDAWSVRLKSAAIADGSSE